MGSYKDLIKSEGSKFFKAEYPNFLEDSDEHGGKAKIPNFLKWLDRTEKLNTIVEGISSKWGMKDFQWVQANTRNPAPAGGDAKSNSYGSFYSDLLHELKKLKKNA